MKKKQTLITIGYLLYLILIFAIFFKTDKRMVAVFCAVGAAIYVVLIKRFSDKK